MRDTDWRPSPCPACGQIRVAAEHPVCKNPRCVPKGSERTRGMFKTSLIPNPQFKITRKK